MPLLYSAEIVRSDGDVTMVYSDGWKRRVDGQTTIAIWRPDLGKGYMIETLAKTCFAYSITTELEAMLAIDIEDDVEWEHVGREELGSHVVDVFDVFGKGKTRRRARVWVDAETHIRWREVTYNKLGEQVLTIETRNVGKEPPPDSVFELPPGLQEIDLGEVGE